MLTSVLIANRGEIACRIARTAKRLGLRTIAVYSEADAGALHTRLCDEAYPIGPAPAADSYLSIERLIDAAKRFQAQCVHPGYGFLSENPDFAEACAGAGIVFVGPSAAAIRAMGLKDHAKTLMEKAGVPVVPGYHGERQDTKFLKEKSYEVGYPVLIKPAAGGGGRGLRRVDKHADFEAELESAIREAAAAFGLSRVLIEKYVTAPRHIEIQVFGDSHGNVIHLNERDCSLQRRHQKVIEEAPAPGMTKELRERMGAAAVAAAKAVHYAGAGTAEFIADGSQGLRADRFWFMEMNTRLQVEHPVTEAITGLDLVEWQFRVASGERLPLTQDEVRIDGHAVEARVYAEDPEHGFLPSTGRIVALTLPDAVRVDTGVEAGGVVTPYYDPMIAKLIAHAPTRAAALEQLADALDRTLVVGPRSNVPFLAALCRAQGFHDGKVDTGFIERNLAELGPHGPDRAAAAFGVLHLLLRDRAPSDEDATEADSPWDARDGFQLGPARSVALPVVVDGERVVATVTYGRDGAHVAIDGIARAADATLFEDEDEHEVFVLRKGRQTRVRLDDFAHSAANAGAGDGVIRAPMHGKVLALLVEAGERVTRGQRVAVIEAMKMEHTLTAPSDGVVADIAVHKDSQVVEGAKIMLIEPAHPSLK
jgi:3-methylcrotonyl-CoA carboxylase alpha subunit